MHELKAIIGSTKAIDELKRLWPSVRARELMHDFLIVPLDERLTAEIAGAEFEFPDLEDDDIQNRIGAGMLPLLQALSGAASLHFGLICTQYWGGAGNQMAVLFGENRFTGPFIGPGAINRALEHLGIAPDRPGQRDSFSVAGLERWRSVEDFIQEAS
jgi:hypothetical protein